MSFSSKVFAILINVIRLDVIMQKMIMVIIVANMLVQKVVVIVKGHFHQIIVLGTNVMNWDVKIKNQV